MRVELLGQPALVGRDGRRVVVTAPRPAALLAALALEHPRPLHRSELVELLWPDDKPADPPHAVRHVVSRARALLVAVGEPGDALVSSEGSTSLRLDVVAVDALEAIDAVATAERALASGNHDAARRAATQALAALDRDLAVADRPYFVLWHERLVAAGRRARAAAAAAALALDQAPSALGLAEQAVSDDPFDEHATRLLMRALAQSGKRAGALAVYERLRRRLDAELGVRPAPETEALFVDLLGDAPVDDSWRPAAASMPAVDAAVPFVGRSRELATLDAAWRAAASSSRQQIVVVTGEAGIGKTRLVGEAATAAADDGVLVVWGRCHASGAPPYEPFGDLLSQLVAARPNLVRALGRVLDDVALLVPELEPISGTRSRSFDERARERVFHAVTTAIGHVAGEPLVLVVDDLQWAGDDALALLLRVIDATIAQPVLFVLVQRVASRTTTVLTGDLVRRDNATVLRLEGLGVAEVGELIERSKAQVATTTGAAAAALAARAGGNALFVTQFVRDALSSAEPIDATELPPVLVDILAGRFASLDEVTRALLDVAAVLGVDVALDELESSAEVSAAVVLDALDELRRARLLDERGVDALAFVHELVRDAVLVAMGPNRAAALHERVARVLIGRGAEPERVAAHLWQSRGKARDEAVAWSVLAGEAALERGAWAAASEHFGRAIDAAPSPEWRVRALTGQGRAERAAGRFADALTALSAARELAREHGLAHEFGAATLAMLGGGGRGAAVDLPELERARLLREAVDALSETDDVALRVAVIGELALALVLTDAVDERLALCDEALKLARASGDPASVAAALQTRRIALMGPAGTVARAGDAREVLALPAGALAIERRIAARLALVEDLFELGDRDGARGALASARDLVADFPHAYWRWATESWGVLDALIDCRVDEVEGLAGFAFAEAGGDHPEAVEAFGVQLTNLRLLQGRAGEVVDLLRDAADSHPQIPCYRAVLALCCAEAGDHDGAAAAFDRLAARGDDFDVPPDSNWLMTVALLADVAATLRRGDAAPALVALLEPYGDRHVVLNCYGGGGAYWGPVAHHLARLAGLLDDDGGARRWRRRAIAAGAAFATPWVQRRDAALADATR